MLGQFHESSRLGIEHLGIKYFFTDFTLLRTMSMSMIPRPRVLPLRKILRRWVALFCLSILYSGQTLHMGASPLGSYSIEWLLTQLLATHWKPKSTQTTGHILHRHQILQGCFTFALGHHSWHYYVQVHTVLTLSFPKGHKERAIHQPPNNCLLLTPDVFLYIFKATLWQNVGWRQVHSNTPRAPPWLVPPYHPIWTPDMKPLQPCKQDWPKVPSFASK